MKKHVIITCIIAAVVFGISLVSGCADPAAVATTLPTTHQTVSRPPQETPSQALLSGATASGISSSSRATASAGASTAPGGVTGQAQSAAPAGSAASTSSAAQTSSGRAASAQNTTLGTASAATPETTTVRANATAATNTASNDTQKQDGNANATSNTAAASGAAGAMATEANRELLQKGDEGDNVAALQNSLQQLGYMTRTTGYFGSETEAAVKAFQANNNLGADGIVGSRTWDNLLSGSAKAA